MRTQLKLSVSTVALLFFVATLFVAATIIKADFSGDWALDATASTMGGQGGGGQGGGGGRGGRGGGAAAKLKVVQEAGGLTVVRTSTGMNGEVITTDKLTNDGKESVSTGGREGSVRKVVAKWSSDQNTLTVTSITQMNFNGNSFENNGKETWSLSADGKILTIDVETTNQNGATTSKLIYNKQ